MNRTWISHGSWQSCGRKTGVEAGRWVGWLANWQEDERAGLRWCLLLGGAAQCRMKHEDRRQRSGQLRRWAGVGCDQRLCECEDLLKKIEEGGEKMRCGCISLQLLIQQRKEKRYLPSCVYLLPQWRNRMQRKRDVWQFQASVAQITNFNCSLVQQQWWNFLLHLETQKTNKFKNKKTVLLQRNKWSTQVKFLHILQPCESENWKKQLLIQHIGIK